MTVVQSQPLPFDWATLVPLVVHPTKVAIIESLRRIGRPLSPTDLGKVFEGRVMSRTISYHLGALVQAGVVSQVGQRKMRGATEKFYFLADSPDSEPGSGSAFAGIDAQ